MEDGHILKCSETTEGEIGEVEGRMKDE
jgi:hypothetical protein